MPANISRRQILAGSLVAVPALSASRPTGVLVDTHVHLFSADPQRFPYPPDAPYQPKPFPVEEYLKVVAAARIDHTVIVHPEPYQDDHRYLEYCFAHEPSLGYFKGTCLFDPIAPATPQRMETLVKRNPKRIVALRIHEMRKPGTPPSSSGAIKDRDMQSPATENTWRKAQELDLAIQMHFLPYFAPQIGELARKFPGVPVLLDHLARAGQGTPADFEQVLRLARLPRVYMKYSGIEYSSTQPFPYLDAKPLVRRAFDAFGPDRILWGGLGNTLEDFDKQTRLFDLMFDFADEPARAKIRGLNAMKLFGF
ncbi:MAG: amidohydrolase [Acidobacteriia bacterium]|nr:amidohydrolase [Terriglobia bacterium]